MIIERTIGLVLGPSTSLYRSVLEHCTLTNKAVGTINGTCPNLLRGYKALIIVPSVCKSGFLQPFDLNSLQDGQSIAYSGGCFYIFLIYYFYHLICLCIHCDGLSALVFCWSPVFIIFKRVPFFDFSAHSRLDTHNYIIEPISPYTCKVQKN